MFVISYREHGKENKVLGTAEMTKLAKQCIEEHFGQPVPPNEFEVNDNHDIVFNIGNAEYVIQSVQHWS